MTSLALALACLNVALTFQNLWPTPWISIGLDLSVELAVTLALLALLAHFGVTPGPRAVALLAGLYMLLALARYADVTVPALFGRPINLYWDARHLPRVAAMLAESAAAWTLAFAGLASVVAIASACMLFGWAWRQVAQALVRPTPRRTLGFLGAGLAALFFAGHAGLPGIERLFAKPVTLTYSEQVAFLRDALSAGGTRQRLPPAQVWASDLQGVRGADIFVVFFESYGAITFDNPSYAASLDAARAELDAAIHDTGRRVVSARVESPTFGGRSWLAHASLLAGTDVREPGIYDLLLTTERPTLVTYFRSRGFRTVALMPGLRSDWPEGDFYRFEQIYGSRELAYAGPEFGWWRIPDQFALARLDQAEVMPAGREPLFVFFPTITSHVPFHPTPPYQPDWARLLSASPYDGDTLHDALGREPEWTNLGPAYVETVAYDYATLAGYLRLWPERDFILLVLGDHQPPAGVTGKDATWDVPVHLIASRDTVLDALRASGFADGLTPREPALGRMHELTALLLRAFASDAGARPTAVVEQGVDIAGAGVLGHPPELMTHRAGVEPIGRGEPVRLAR